MYVIILILCLQVHLAHTGIAETILEKSIDRLEGVIVDIIKFALGYAYGKVPSVSDTYRYAKIIKSNWDVHGDTIMAPMKNVVNSINSMLFPGKENLEDSKSQEQTLSRKSNLFNKLALSSLEMDDTLNDKQKLSSSEMDNALNDVREKDIYNMLFPGNPTLQKQTISSSEINDALNSVIEKAINSIFIPPGHPIFQKQTLSSSKKDVRINNQKINKKHMLFPGNPWNSS